MPGIVAYREIVLVLPVCGGTTTVLWQALRLAISFVFTDLFCWQILELSQFYQFTEVVCRALIIVQLLVCLAPVAIGLNQYL